LTKGEILPPMSSIPSVKINMELKELTIVDSPHQNGVAKKIKNK
jgi:hypothetical protein